MGEPPEATARRRALVQHLRAERSITSDAVEAALLAVPRHVFVPHVSLAEAYDNRPVLLQRASDGTPLSTASQPSMVALMLEELAVERGQRVLEIGTASGYNAALLAHLAGPSGRVVSVEIDPALATTAASALAPWPTVSVVVSDGRAGHPAGAPYDRIVVTVGAAEVAPAWHEQLAEGGRLVVPLTDDTGSGMAVTFDERGGELVRGRSIACSFVTMRSG